MINRRTFFAITAGALMVAGRVAEAQQTRIYRIGFLGSESASEFASRVEAFRGGLRDLGYVEGRNITIEFRWADGDAQRLPGLAAELVRLNVDVLVTHATLGTQAAMQATTTIPIIMAIGADAILSGIVKNLARPGGNVTGSTIFTPEVSIKRLSLLKEAVPRIDRVAILVRRDRPDNDPILETMKASAESMRLSLQSFDVAGPQEFANAFDAMKGQHVNALAIRDDPFLILNSALIAEMAAKHRLPSVGPTDFAEAGGMIGYGVDALEIFRHAAVFVDKILKGAKPGDLPIEQATKFRLVVNFRTVGVLGLKIPRPVLVRADEVIQ
jgi:putative ABC transport system substrate-binding protein